MHSTKVIYHHAMPSKQCRSFHLSTSRIWVQGPQGLWDASALQPLGTRTLCWG